MFVWGRAAWLGVQVVVGVRTGPSSPAEDVRLDGPSWSSASTVINAPQAEYGQPARVWHRAAGRERDLLHHKTTKRELWDEVLR